MNVGVLALLIAADTRVNGQNDYMYVKLQKVGTFQ